MKGILTSVPHIGYWRSLGSSPDFTDKIFKDCADVIHTDVVGVWSLRDHGVCLFPHLVVSFYLGLSVSFERRIQDQDV